MTNAPALPVWLRARIRLLGWRNRLLANPRFQRHAARNPLLRPIARQRAGALFDLVAGFTYTQALLATVESGLLDELAGGPKTLADASHATGLADGAAERLLRAATAIGIAEEAAPGLWMLGRHGAALQANEGALAMIRHHRLLYRDLAEPLALLGANRSEPTALSRFWDYSSEDGEGVRTSSSAYSRLMSASQAPVSEEVLFAFPFRKYASLLDIGGGLGTFLSAVAARHPHLRLGLFDLPAVVAQARDAAPGTPLEGRTTYHPGSFFHDPVPGGYELVSLVRILHDHDDEKALAILTAIRRSLLPGGALLIAEPMAATRGAEAMGDAYFGLYLWAMNAGRPRSAGVIRRMLQEAGFRRSRQISTGQPLITSLIVATA